MTPASTSTIGLPDWHDAAPYARLVTLDRAGMAWEWLRRDPAYRLFHAESSSEHRGGEDGAVVRALPQVPSARWGLLFR